jgi:hypothetical protein
MAAATVRAMVHSQKPSLVSEAIARLIAEGHVVEVKSGRSKVLRLERPYLAPDVENDEPPPPPPPPDPDLFTDYGEF